MSPRIESDGGGGENDDSSLPRWAAMPAKFGEILKFLGKVVEDADVYGTFGVDRYAELFILTTHSRKRHPGLGTEMTRRTLEMLAAEGFGLCVTEATSLFSQKIFTRLGFSDVSEIRYDDYKPDGSVVFPSKPPHESVKLMAKTM